MDATGRKIGGLVDATGKHVNTLAGTTNQAITKVANVATSAIESIADNWSKLFLMGYTLQMGSQWSSPSMENSDKYCTNLLSFNCIVVTLTTISTASIVAASCLAIIRQVNKMAN